ncbi:hypothetical protein Bbelb_353600 [Branchiostoma belcheri]|nr:hypothetical protein Bbelb_353600 [Branchiostoma belcheri]
MGDTRGPVSSEGRGRGMSGKAPRFQGLRCICTSVAVSAPPKGRDPNFQADATVGEKCVTSRDCQAKGPERAGLGSLERISVHRYVNARPRRVSEGLGPIFGVDFCGEIVSGRISADGSRSKQMEGSGPLVMHLGPGNFRVISIRWVYRHYTESHVQERRPSLLEHLICKHGIIQSNGQRKASASHGPGSLAAISSAGGEETDKQGRGKEGATNGFRSTLRERKPPSQADVRIPLSLKVIHSEGANSVILGTRGRRTQVIDLYGLQTDRLDENIIFLSCTAGRDDAKSARSGFVRSRISGQVLRICARLKREEPLKPRAEGSAKAWRSADYGFPE